MSRSSLITRNRYNAFAGAATVITNIALIVAVTTAQAAPGGDAENAPAYWALCGLIRQCEKGFSEPKAELPAEARATYAGIVAASHLASLNNTFVMDQIQKKADGLLETLQPMPESKATVQLKELMNSTYEEATKIKTAAETAARQLANKIQKANELLREAVSGRKQAVDSDGTASAYFKGDPNAEVFGKGPSQEHNCGANGAASTTSNNVGITLINDLFCVCIRGQAGTEKICLEGPPATALGTLTYASADAAMKAAYVAIMAKCPKATERTTAHSLAAAVERYNTQIGGQSAKATSNNAAAAFIVGYAANPSTGCTGSTSQICINYKLKIGTKDAPGLTWQNKIRQAIAKLEHDTGEAKVSAATTTLMHMNKTIWQLYHSAFAQTDSLMGSPQPKPAVNAKKSAECKEHKPKKTCEENGCKWNGTNEQTGTCVAKPAEQANQGAGDGAAGKEKKEEKCSKKKVEG